jgi:DNA-binding response OmpR family regulator
MTSLQGRRILLVDDEPCILGLLQRLLASAGAQVQTAMNGREALHLFQSTLPDLVLLDDKLPDIDGWQLYLRIREQSSVPIIFLPAVWPPSSIMRVRDAAGVIDCIPKPFRPDVLVAHAWAALRRAELARVPQE